MVDDSIIPLLLGLPYAQMRALIDLIAVPIGVIDVPPAGPATIVAANRQVLTDYGFAHEKVAGKPLHSVFGEAGGAAVDDMVRQCLRSGQALAYERQSQLTSPPGMWVQVTLMPIVAPDGAGRPVSETGRALITILNIQHRKSIEAELQSSQQALQRAQQIGRMCHWRRDVATGKTVWSANSAEVFRAPDDLPSGAEWLEVPDTEQARLQAVRDAAEASRSGYTFELNGLTQSGEPISVHMEAEPQFDPAGALIAYFGIAQDVTEQTRARRAIAQSEKALQQAQRLGRMGHGWIDLDADSFHWSATLRALHGLTDNSAHVWPMDKLLRYYLPEDARQAREKIAECRRTGKAFSQVVRIVTPSGERRVLNIEAEPQHDDTGQVRQIFTVTQDVTDQQRMRSRLQVREAALERACQLGRMGHWYIDTGRQQISWSPETFALYGLDPVQFVPSMDNVAPLYAPQSAKRMTALRKAALASGTGWDVRLEYPHPDGNVRRMHVVAEPDHDEDGRLVGYFGITVDETPAWQAQQALEQSEAALQRAQRMGRMGHWRVDLKDLTFHWSAAVHELHDMPRDFPKVGPLEDILSRFSTTDRTRLERIWANPQAYASGFSQEARVRSGAGRLQYVRMEARAELDEAGTVIGFFGITQDLTRLHETQHALQVREAQLQRAMTIGQMGYWYWTLQGNTFWWSPQMYQLYGVNPADFRPSMPAIMGCYQPQQRHHIAQVRDTAVQQQQPLQFDAAIDLPDGTVRWVEVTAEPDRGRDGQIVGYAGVTRDITEARQARIVLERSERNLQRAQRVGRIGHWEHDLKTGALIWSDVLYEIHGLDSADYTPDINRVLPLYTPEKQQEILQRRVAAIAAKSGYRFSAEISKPDGTPLAIDVIAEPQLDSDGALIGFFGTTRDVTQERLRERALAESEAVLRKALWTGRMGHWRLSLPDGGLRWSDQLFSIFGLDPEVFAPSITSLVPLLQPSQRRTFRRLYVAAVRSGKPQSFELEMVDSHGAPVTVFVEAEPEHDEQGRLTGYFGVTQDISRRRAAERRARDSQKQNEQIVDALNDAQIGVATLGDDGRIISANMVLAQILGLATSQALLGRRWRTLRRSLDAQYDALGHEMRTALRASGVWEKDLVWPSLDGADRHVFVRATRLVSGMVLLIVVDRSDLVRARLLTEQIERNLQQTQKMEALGQLAGGVAHEVNNLLQPILTFSRHSQKPDLPDDKRSRYLALIHSAAEQMRDIVASTLAFSRPSTDRRELTSADALLERALAFVQPTLPFSVLLVVHAAGSDDVQIDVVPGELNQVLLNLVLNAVDAVAREGRISVSWSVVDSPARLTSPPIPAGRYLRIDVEDDGPGFSPEVAARLYEPFFTTKPLGQGTGLGLSVVYGIVRRWGGGVEARNIRSGAGGDAPVRGACFTLFVPVALARADGLISATQGGAESNPHQGPA